MYNLIIYCFFSYTGTHLDDVADIVPNDLSDAVLWPREPRQIPSMSSVRLITNSIRVGTQNGEIVS